MSYLASSSPFFTATDIQWQYRTTKPDMDFYANDATPTFYFKNNVGTTSDCTIVVGSIISSALSGSQLTSTVATGTPPLVVASTTKVSNLNADLLDGADWAAPLAIGTTTPVAGTFTALTTAATPGGFGLNVHSALGGGQSIYQTLGKDASDSVSQGYNYVPGDGTYYLGFSGEAALLSLSQSTGRLSYVSPELSTIASFYSSDATTGYTYSQFGRSGAGNNIQFTMYGDTVTPANNFGAVELAGGSSNLKIKSGVLGMELNSNGPLNITTSTLVVPATSTAGAFTSTVAAASSAILHYNADSSTTLASFGNAGTQGNSALLKYIQSGPDSVNNRVELLFQDYATPPITFYRDGRTYITDYRATAINGEGAGAVMTNIATINGAAPLTVGTFAAPPDIGNTTPAYGYFTGVDATQTRITFDNHFLALADTATVFDLASASNLIIRKDTVTGVPGTYTDLATFTTAGNLVFNESGKGIAGIGTGGLKSAGIVGHAPASGITVTNGGSMYLNTTTDKTIAGTEAMATLSLDPGFWQVSLWCNFKNNTGAGESWLLNAYLGGEALLADMEVYGVNNTAVLASLGTFPLAVGVTSNLTLQCANASGVLSNIINRNWWISAHLIA